MPLWDNGRNWLLFDTLDPYTGQGFGSSLPGFTEHTLPDAQVGGTHETDYAMVAKTAMSSLGQAAANTDLDANTYHRDYGHGLFRERRHWKQKEEDGGKMLEGDFGHFGYRDHFDIVPPLPPAHIFGRAAATNANRRFLTFFKGKGSNSVRRAVIDLHDPTRGVIMVDSSGKGKKEFSYDCAYTCVHFVRV